MSARRFMTAAAKAAKTSNKEALSVDGLADKVSVSKQNNMMSVHD